MQMPNGKSRWISLIFFLSYLLLIQPAAAEKGAGKEVTLKNITYSLEDTGEKGVKKYTMEADFPATKDKVCGVICDYYHLNTFMPKDIRSKVITGTSNRLTMEVTMDLPWPFEDVRSTLLVEFDKKNASARWKLVGGNIKRNDGTIEIIDRGDYSHVKQVTYLNIGRYYPGWFIKMYTRTQTYKIMRAIRERLEAEERSPALP